MIIIIHRQPRAAREHGRGLGPCPGSLTSPYLAGVAPRALRDDRDGPSVSQSMIALGVDLGEFVTLRSVKHALRHILQSDTED